MIFLIEYRKKTGELLTYKEFDKSEQGKADDERLEMELRDNEMGNNHEIVILEAQTLAALKKTHGRYFRTTE